MRRCGRAVAAQRPLVGYVAANEVLVLLLRRPGARRWQEKRPIIPVLEDGRFVPANRRMRALVLVVEAQRVTKLVERGRTNIDGRGGGVEPTEAHGVLCLIRHS